MFTAEPRLISRPSPVMVALTIARDTKGAQPQHSKCKKFMFRVAATATRLVSLFVMPAGRRVRFLSCWPEFQPCHARAYMLLLSKHALAYRAPPLFASFWAQHSLLDSDQFQ